MIGRSKHMYLATTMLEKKGKVYVASLLTPKIAIIDAKKAKKVG